MNVLLSLSRSLCTNLRTLFPRFETHDNFVVYSVLDYAWNAWETYVKTYALPSAHTLIVGINPGPHGMVQTGIPFGAISCVKNYLHLSPSIGTPKKLHPKRPVRGMAYSREEPSGHLLWSCIRSCFPCPAEFFKQCFVLNYCPLAFFSESGENKLPQSISKEERREVDHLCSDHLLEYVRELSISRVLAVGTYTLHKALSLFAPYTLIRKENIIYIPHPSPLNRRRHLFAPTIEDAILSVPH